MGRIGSIEWTERTGGALTARECVSLAEPLHRDGSASPRGCAMALRRHSGRRSTVDPAALVPPDSSWRETPRWPPGHPEPGPAQPLAPRLRVGSAIAALQGITFDCELLYVASMFHDTGLPSLVPHVDFTVRSAELAREFTARHGCRPTAASSSPTPSPCTTLPGWVWSRRRGVPPLRRGGVDVFGLRSDEVPDAVRRRVFREFPRLGFKREFSRLWRAEARQVPHGRAWLLHRFALTDLSIRLAPFRD